jgi:hypothetical protein
MAMFRVVSIAVALAASACRPAAPDLPETSADAEQLRWVEHADPAADMRDRVERQRDSRFVSVYSFSTPGAFGVDDSPDLRQLVQRHGERTLEGTSDIVTSREHLRLRSKAQSYVKQYNEHLLRYLREHPDI